MTADHPFDALTPFDPALTRSLSKASQKGGLTLSADTVSDIVDTILLGYQQEIHFGEALANAYRTLLAGGAPQAVTVRSDRFLRRKRACAEYPDNGEGSGPGTHRRSSPACLYREVHGEVGRLQLLRLVHSGTNASDDLVVSAHGRFGVDHLGALGRAVWLEPAARLRLAVDEPGTVNLRLAAPRPTPAVRVRTSWPRNAAPCPGWRRWPSRVRPARRRTPSSRPWPAV